MDVVIYIRWSSAEQAKGSSLERQRDDCLAHAQRHGWNVVDMLIDDGVSAFAGKHSTEGKLGRFIAHVKDGRYPAGIVLLAEKLDRLSRQDAKTVFLWMATMIDAGVTIATVDGDRRYDRTNLDMASIIEVVVKAQLAHEESQKKSDRLAAAWRKKRDKVIAGDKLVMTQRAPAWLAVEGSPPAFVVIEERAAIVRRIFQQTADGFGKQHIARNLNLDGVPTFGRATGWHSSYVQKILHSTTTLGDMQPGMKPRSGPRELVGDPIPDYYPAIVPADLYARAHASMAGRARKVSGRGRRLVNLFAGLSTCASCGSKMTFRGRGKAQRADGTIVNEDYLVCDARQRGRGCPTAGHFNYTIVEAAVLDAILDVALKDHHFAAPAEGRAIEVEIAERDRNRAGLRDRATNALDAFTRTGRREAEELWLSLVTQADAEDVALDALRSRLTKVRGAVPPEQHVERIRRVRASMSDEDEDVRFQARSLVRVAIHDLVASIRFAADQRMVDVELASGGSMKLAVYRQAASVVGLKQDLRFADALLKTVAAR